MATTLIRVYLLLLCAAWRVCLPPTAHAAAPTATRIITLAPNLTELVYAVGAESLLVGTVEYSDFPDAAKQIPRVGDAFRVDYERILALQPDLILAWESGTPTTVIDHLRHLKLRVINLNTDSLAQLSATLRTVGALTQHTAEAEQRAQQFEQAMEALRQGYATHKKLRVFIEIEARPLFTVNGTHIISEIIELCGGQNVFAGLSQRAAAVSLDAILTTNPQVILAGAQNTQELHAQWAPWSTIHAVHDQHLYAVDPDLLTRATPRLADAATAVCQALESARNQPSD